MAKYVNKSALVAEIEKRRDESWLGMYTKEKGIIFDITDDILSFINTLEVKEVDLDAEFDKYCETLYLIDLENEPYAELFECAKYFFELGLNAQRKISYVPNIDDSLKELGVDPSSKEAKIFKESYYAALDKFMTQKGG